MSTTKDIEDAVNIFRENNCSFELMHCVSTYPMKTEHANLLSINSLKKLLIAMLDIVDMKTEWLFLLQLFLLILVLLRDM